MATGWSDSASRPGARPRIDSTTLENGNRVGVIGGGPAGSLFSYFLLKLAARVGLELQVDIYEPRDYSASGPPGCNMCAGIISETLVQMLAMEGIFLPPEVVQRGMHAYVLHTDYGEAHFETPQQERKIATVYRGAGPATSLDPGRRSFDGYLLEQAVAKGARLIPARVNEVQRVDSGFEVRPRGRPAETYDLLAVAVGVNTSLLKLFPAVEPEFKPPQTTHTFIREYYLGQQAIKQYLGGHTIHFFFVNSPGLDFAAIVPKGSYVSAVAIGQDIDQERFDAFMNSAPVQACMPPEWRSTEFVCRCSPRINVGAAGHPFGDRLVFLGDSGVSRLYKDGIGAAYRTAKNAATTAVFHGIGAGDFRRHYYASSLAMERDNRLGKKIFAGAGMIKPHGRLIRTMLHLVAAEQAQEASQRRMSLILWDMFTGSAPYREILRLGLHPLFIGRWLWYLISDLQKGIR